MTSTGDIESSLRAWVEDKALPGRTIAATKVLTGGYSNHNVRLTMDDGAEFVLRRYLGGNACPAEAALARRLAGVVPVAEVVAADESGPEPVLLSRFVPGRPVSEILDPAEAAELARSVGAALAGIGSVSFDNPGFFTDGSLIPGPPGTEPISGLDSFVDRCLAEGNAAGHLSDAEQRVLRRAAAEATPELAGLAGSRRLVHGDYNPKNLLAVRREGRWEVAAVLDWEYAFSSSPLFDIGNMLRDPRPAGFEEAFLAGYVDNGGELPDNWRRLSRALDLYSLADFLTRPADHRYFRKSVARIRAMLAA